MQAPAPARLIEGGLPTEATVAHVLVSNADHLPLTLADWVGRAACHLRPVHSDFWSISAPRRKSSPTKRPHPCWIRGADAPRPVNFGPMRDVYTQNRKSEQPLAHLSGFSGVVQVDGYAGYRALAQKNSGSLAFSWAHVRRGIYDLAAAGQAPIAKEALTRIGALYAVEKDIRGRLQTNVSVQRLPCSAVSLGRR